MTRKLHIVLLFFCSTLAAFGQSASASLTGVVRDSTGAVVPNAAVRATNTGTSAEFQTTTNSEGQYTIRTMPVGVYRVAIEATGFKRQERTDVRLQIDEVVRVDATLD